MRSWDLLTSVLTPCEGTEASSLLVPVEAELGVWGKRNGELEVVCLGEEWEKKDHRDPDKYAGDYSYRYFKKIIILNTPKSLLCLIFLLWKFIILGEKSMTSSQNTNSKIKHIEGKYRGRRKIWLVHFLKTHFTCARNRLQI